ncbi:MAG: hypothetical protein H0W72_17255, partial [Planctomycetes bacterium]|nr:hypothetical protein [Planctomycetota bacterium]
VKLTRRDEFVVGGYLLREDQRQGLGALLLGYYRDEADARTGCLRYAGKVGTGFSDDERARLKRRCDAQLADQRPFSAKTPHDRVAIWTQPTLVVEIQYAEWTHDLHVRHASYKGLRVDKRAVEVVTSPV